MPKLIKPKKIVKKKRESFDEEELQSLAKKTKSKIKTVRTYVVGLALIKFRQNLMIRVRANNDYCAILEAMRKFTRIQAEEYPEKAGWIEESWEAEEKMLTARCRDFNSLHNYLCCIGFIVSKPLIIEDDSIDLDTRTRL